MNRRQYLAGAASTAGFLLAGCSSGGNDETGGGGGASGSGENGGGNGGDDGATNAGAGSEAPTEDTSIISTGNDEAIDTGQAPPDETQTPFENTNTVPEEDGLETGQAPNATDEDS